MLGGTLALIAVGLVVGALLLVLVGAIARVELEEAYARRKVRHEGEEWRRAQAEEEPPPALGPGDAEFEQAYEDEVCAAIERRRRLYMLWLHDVAARRETALVMGFSQGPGESCVLQ